MLTQQNEIDAANSEVMDQTREFNENYEKLQSDWMLLNERILYFMERERKSWLAYLTMLVKAIWRKRILKIFEKVGCSIKGNNIEGFYRKSD